MDYTPTVWEDLPSTDTPITAAQLNKLETGVDQAHVDLAGKAADVHTHDRGDLRSDAAALAATVLNFLDADDAAGARAAIGAGTPTSGGGGTVSGITVASFYATQEVKDASDFACATATDNQVEINQAITLASRGPHGSFTGDGFGGESRIAVQLVGPTFNIGDTTASGGAIKMLPNVSLRGLGKGTFLIPKRNTADRGVIEMGGSLDDIGRFEIRDLTIVSPGAGGAPAAFTGDGIRITQAAYQVYDGMIGGSGDSKIENVEVHRATGRGFYFSASFYGQRTRFVGCMASRCQAAGFYIDGQDAVLDGCISTAGAAAPRFHLTANAENVRVYGCKADGGGSDGPVTTGADGFLVEVNEYVLDGCVAQDCGGYGFNFQAASGNGTSSNLMAVSNSQAGFRIAHGGVYSGIHATYTGTAGAPTGSFPQNVGILVVATPKCILHGRSKLPNTGTAHVSGAFAANSIYQVLRFGAGASSLAETPLVAP